MNEHLNKRTKKWRYKKYKVSPQKFMGNVFYDTNLGFNFKNYVNNEHFEFIRSDYSPYWLFRLLWSFKVPKYQNPNNKLSPQSKRHTTVVFLMIIGIIIAIIVGWNEIVNFYNSF